MRISATEAQVIEMGKLAVMASVPMGLGFLHYNPALVKSDIDIEVNGRDGRELFIDYFQGRMVKFIGSKQEDGEWEFPDSIHPEYQSWIYTYPDYRALFEAARPVDAVDPVAGVVTE